MYIKIFAFKWNRITYKLTIYIYIYSSEYLRDLVNELRYKGIIHSIVA